jgi:hypothetical protein
MKSPDGLHIVYCNHFDDTDSVARVYRDLGAVEINLSRWKKLPKPHRDYILAHEEGHYVLDPSDEFAADEYAFKKMAGTHPGSLRDTAHALIDVLPGSTPEQRQRIEAAVLRALKYDAVNNGNGTAQREYIRLTGHAPKADSFFGPENKYRYIGFGIAAVAVAVIILIKRRNS